MHVPAGPSLRVRDFTRRLPLGAARPFPLDAPETAAFYAARYALYHLLKTLGLGKGDAVLCPAYHHGNEVRAVRASGAGVRFYAVEGDLRLRLDEIERLARPPVRALLAVHTMGFPTSIGPLSALCRRRDILLIEDCAHAFLGSHGGRPLGSYGDYALFCLYKTVPVPNGGLLVRNSPELPAVGAHQATPPDAVSVAGRLAELFVYGVQLRHPRLGGALGDLKRGVGRGLTGFGISRVPVGDTGFDPAAAGTGMSRVSAHLLERFDYARIVERRRANYLQLLRRLAGRARTVVGELPEGSCPLFYPLLVADKTAAAHVLWSRGVETVEFWNTGDPEARGAFPATDFLRAHVLELPIHQDLGPEQVDYVADEVLGLGPLLLPDEERPAARLLEAR